MHHFESQPKRDAKPENAIAAPAFCPGYGGCGATLRTWFRALADGQIILLPNADDIEAAAGLGLEVQHPLPDCLYLAAAERLGVALITADRVFARRAQQRSNLVQLLGEANE